MTHRSLRALPPRGTRLSRADARKHRLESAAAEFALGAQRRARLLRQLDLLDRQRHGTSQALAQIETRLATLARRMAELDAFPPAGGPPPPSEAGATQAGHEAPGPRRARRGGRVTLEY